MMAENPSPGRKASWRGRGAPLARPGRAPGRRPGGWSQREDKAPLRAGQRHRLKVALGFIGLMLLLAGFVIYLLYRPIRTPLIVLAATDYRWPVPPNSLAEEDAHRFARLGEEEIVSYSRARWDSTEQGILELQAQLDAARPGGPGKNVVLLYVSMHGAVDGDGEPCFIPPGVPARDASCWLPVRRLLEEVFASDRPGKIDDRVHKVLILDADRIASSWRLGMVDRGFADRLRTVVEQLKIPRLHVLTSAGPGQTGWVAPELGGSLLAHFLQRGLHGAADAAPRGDQSGTVSLLELHAYLKTQVGHWAVAHRAARQEPLLISSENVELVYAQAGGDEPAEAIPLADDPRWQRVAALWSRHAGVEPQEPWRLQPVRWALFQAKLVHLERLILAGSAYRNEAERVADEVEGLARKLEGPSQHLPADLAAYSLPLAQRLSGGADIEAARSRLEEILDEAPESAPKKETPEKPAGKVAADGDQEPSETETSEAAKPEEPAESPPALQAPCNHLDASRAAWQWALDGLEASDLRRVLQFVADAPGRLAPGPVEAHFLHMLDAHLDRTVEAQHLRESLRARHLAEQAATPADLRVFYAIQARVDRADAKRRLAEDRLFVGQRVALAQAAALWKGVSGPEGDYPAAVELADRLAEAYRLRDRAWAESPHLAAWILAAREDPAGSSARLIELARANAALATEVERAVDAAAWTDTLGQSVVRVRDALSALRSAYDDQCRRLDATAARDSRTLRDIAAVLSVPLLSGEPRNRLRVKYLEILAAGAGSDLDLAESGSDASDELAGPPRGSDTGDETATPIPDHPALAIVEQAVSGEIAEEAAPEQLHRQGQSLRRRVAGIPSAAREHMDRTAAALARPGPASIPGDVRIGCARADRLVRATSFLFSDDPWADVADSPAGRLERIDLHYLLRWHARRAMDDFWGPAPGEAAPHFALAAAACLESARAICPEAADLAGEQAPEPQMLARRCAAAADGVRPSGFGDLFVDDLDPAVRNPIAVHFPAALPPGEAAVFLRAPRGETLAMVLGPEPTGPTARRVGVPSAASAEAHVDCWIPNDGSLTDRSLLELVALYRGHVRRADLFVHPAQGISITQSRPVPRAPTVTVRGTARQRGSIMFILDYSISMDQTLVREVGKRKIKTKRYIVARTALQTILDRIVDPENPYRVGVWVYGHRVGWNEDHQIIMWDPESPDRTVGRPPDVKLHPADDVQPILRLGRFGSADYAKVKRALDDLRPIGETPLYLSILKAIEDLRAAPASGERRIVVITDGVNWQSSGGEEGVVPKKQVEDALERAGSRDIRLDIVGFQITEEDLKAHVKDIADPGQRQEFLNDLLRRFGDLKHLADSFYSAGDPSGLLRALEKSLKLSQFVVEPVGARPERKPEPLDLGQTWAVEKAPDRKTEYRARIADSEQPVEAAFQLAGGEALELELVHSPLRLVHQRYQRELRSYRAAVADPGDPQRRFFVGAHLPERRGTAVRFPISIQSDDAEEFSPRPEDVCVEIRARGSTPGEEAACVFFDPDWEPGRPVPVASCQVPNWPSEAKAAQIRAWWKLDRTPPDRVVSVADAEARGLGLDILPEVRFSLKRKRGNRPEDPYRVIVTERHPAGAELATVRVEMIPRPWKAVHRYVRETGTVRHTFFYEDAVAAEVAGYRIMLTTRRRIQSGAASLGTPLEVVVPRSELGAAP